jgi:hypothetical protein
MESTKSGKLADAPHAATGSDWELRSAEPWVDPQRRQALLQMHQQLGSEWSEKMREYLRDGDQFTFRGFSFESIARCPELNSENGHFLVFSFDRSVVVGAIALSDELAFYLVETQLGSDSVLHKVEAEESKRVLPENEQQHVSSPVRFTRVENALSRKSLALMLGSLGAVYAAAGVGMFKSTDQGASIEISLGLLRDDPLMVFRYSVGEPDKQLSLVVATVVGLVEAIRETPRERLQNDSSGFLALSSAQLEVKLVLGSWNVTIGELSTLRSGDEVVLQDGTDAWLTIGSIPVKPVRVRLDQHHIVVEPTGVADGRE